MAERNSSQTVAGTERFLRSAGDKRFFGVLPILKTLGEGAFGTVYLVLATNPFPRMLALKTIKAKDATSEERDAFRVEAGRWVSLGAHRNIVTAYDVMTPQGEVGVLCDYIAPDEHGRTSLQDWIDARAVTDEQLVRWSLDFCDGMAHAYAHGLTAHRDIKPDNLLVSDGVLCVADFGLSTAAHLLSNAAADYDLTPAGSRPFMPPEQFIIGFRCDQRSDIYAFGVTLYMAVSGGRWPIRPANIEERDAWMYAHARDPVRPLQHFLWPVIEHCLRKRPEQRFGSMNELRDAIASAAQRVGIRVEPRSVDSASGDWEWLKLEHQAHSLALLGYEQESMQLYERAFALHDAPMLWQSKANALLALGRLEQALECVTVALERYEDNSANWYILGDVLRRMEQHEHAVIAYEQALANLRATPYEGAGPAVQQAREAARDEAERIEAQIRNAFSLSLNARGDYTRALAEIGRAVALQPTDVVYRRHKAAVLLGAGQYYSVLQETDAAEAYAENDAELRRIRIHALLQLDRGEQAMHIASQSLAAAPDHPHHLFNYALALSAVHTHDVRRVISAYEAALVRAEPGDALRGPMAAQFIDYLEHVGEHDRALRIAIAENVDRM